MLNIGWKVVAGRKPRVQAGNRPRDRAWERHWAVARAGASAGANSKAGARAGTGGVVTAGPSLGARAGLGKESWVKSQPLAWSLGCGLGRGRVGVRGLDL